MSGRRWTDLLVFVPAGDAALTRRARKASSLSAVVVRWSRTRKRYDTLPMSGTAREDARHQVRPAIDRVLATWTR